MRAVALIIVVIVVLYLLSAEGFVVSNHGPYEFDTNVRGRYIRAVDPGRARALVGS